MTIHAWDQAASIEAQATRQHAEGAVKTWEDLDRYRAVIAASDPTITIECGTFSGYSAMWFARTTGARVITIDTNPQVADDVTSTNLWQQQITQIVGNSTDPAVVKQVHAAVTPDDRVLVVLDSWHSDPHVTAELAAYSPLVTVGSYCVVEDTIVRHIPSEMLPVGPYEGNPWDAADRFAAAHPDTWVLDADIDGMHPQSQHAGGWLRRVR